MASGQVTHRRLNPPQRTFFGPDLSNPSPRAVQGLIASLEGARDADFLRVVEEARRLAAGVFQLKEGEVAILPLLEDAAPQSTLPSLLPAGSRIVAGICGAYGERLAAAAGQVGFDVQTVEARRGDAVPPDALARAVERHRPEAVLLMHGEGETGVLQPLNGLADACRSAGSLLLVDASFTLGGVDLAATDWGIDVAWSGTQRCMSAVAGLTLVAMSPRAVERARQTPPLPLHLRHALDWTYETFPAPLLYALDEVLQLATEQGLPYRFGRHINRQQALISGLETLGLEIAAQPEVRLPSVTAVRVPPGIDGARVRGRLLSRFRLEIGGPVSEAWGPVWRVGVMGHSAAPSSVLLLLSAMEVLLEEQGWPAERGSGARAALDLLEW